MKLPYILLVDDDEQVLHAIQRDIRNQYRRNYRVVATDSAREALELIKQFKLQNETLALIISDQKMPEMEGVDFLEQAKEIYERAKLVLLTAYSDIEAAIRAINKVKLDYYLLKPWSPPEEKLFPVINDLLEEWQTMYKPREELIRIIGFQWSPKSHTLKEFLSGNLVPFQWLDIESNPEAEKYMLSANSTRNDLPIVILKDGKALTDPTLAAVAGGAGLKQQAAEKMYDVVIIGAGPAGLAASVYGATEGLKTLLIEKQNPGGQASSSARIENYLGFPTGLSGSELTSRAIAQTLRFGTEIIAPQEASSIRLQDGYKIIGLSDGSEVHSKSVVIASGIAYRKLEIEGIENFTGAGVYYGAAAIEAHACRNENIYIVGGGNSACQAAMYMSKISREVNILIRQEVLSQAAANYLVNQIRNVENIKVHPHTELVGVSGTATLEVITLKNSATGELSTHPCKALFIYIGAKPGTRWLDESVLKDEKGFILTGRELMKEKLFQTGWKLDREPFLSETSLPGVFVSGDVRSGALTGISSAVGEGAMAIRFVRKYLQEMGS